MCGRAGCPARPPHTLCLSRPGRSSACWPQRHCCAGGAATGVAGGSERCPSDRRLGHRALPPATPILSCNKALTDLHDFHLQSVHQADHGHDQAVGRLASQTAAAQFQMSRTDGAAPSVRPTGPSGRGSRPRSTCGTETVGRWSSTPARLRRALGSCGRGRWRRAGRRVRCNRPRAALPLRPHYRTPD